MGANNLRLVVTKAVLWLLLGLASAVALARYWRGLGATTALTDTNPWGLWIGFDVLSGVALAAGGFVIAASVYIFHLDRYRALVRPAVLTALLGYVAVACGLLVDLGRPWNIWRMILFWQTDSPLFEVGWCVMLYLTVLVLEFAPVVFEGLKWTRPLKLVRRLTLALVIAGIGLSTLHQSSLGTLFLLAKDRIHPLWYTPILPLLFFVSAVGLGLAMVTLESCVTSWLYHKKGEWKLLTGLTRAASVTLMVYLLLRLADLWWRGQLGHVMEGTWVSVLFICELAISTVIPIALFLLPTTRGRNWAVFSGALLCVCGFVLHRADVGGIAHIPVTGEVYLPALTEIIISAGLVSAMAIIFLFFVERFPVWEEQPQIPNHFTPPLADPISRTYFGGYWFGRPHLAALAWVVGVILGVGVLEMTTSQGADPRPHRVRAARATAAERSSDALGLVTDLRLVAEPASHDLPEGFTTALLIDGDRAGTQVVFDHSEHQRRLGAQGSCGRCHHRNFRLERGTPCSACHSDMYRSTDIFNHEQHVADLAGNSSCRRCHDQSGVKTRAGATDCRECHAQDISRTFAVKPSPGLVRGVAPGYRAAMHDLCIGCHRSHEAATAVDEPYLSRCTNCHRSSTAVSEPANVADMIVSSQAPLTLGSGGAGG